MTNINIETIIDNAQQNLTQTFSDIIDKQTVATCYDMFLNHDEKTSIQLSPVMRNLLQTKSFVITPAYAEWVGLNKFSNFCQFEMTPEFLIRVDEDDLNNLPSTNADDLYPKLFAKFIQRTNEQIAQILNTIDANRETFDEIFAEYVADNGKFVDISHTDLEFDLHFSEYENVKLELRTETLEIPGWIFARMIHAQQYENVYMTLPEDTHHAINIQILAD